MLSIYGSNDLDLHLSFKHFQFCSSASIFCFVSFWFGLVFFQYLPKGRHILILTNIPTLFLIKCSLKRQYSFQTRVTFKACVSNVFHLASKLCIFCFCVCVLRSVMITFKQSVFLFFILSFQENYLCSYYTLFAIHSFEHCYALHPFVQLALPLWAVSSHWLALPFPFKS